LGRIYAHRATVGLCILDAGIDAGDPTRNRGIEYGVGTDSHATPFLDHGSSAYERKSTKS
jgi:hypothetical protein